MKKIILVLAAVLVMGAMYGQSGKANKMAERRKMSEEIMKMFYQSNGNYSVADSMMDVYVKTFGDDSEIERMRILRYIAKGDKENALKTADLSLSLNKKDKMYKDADYVYYLKAMIYKGDGNLDAAMAELDKAIKMNKNYAPYLTEKVNLYYMKGDMANAIEGTKRLMKAEPGEPSYVLGYARLLLNAGREDEYVETIDKLIKNAPDFADARLSKMSYLAGRGDMKEAFDVYLEACLIETDDNTESFLNQFSDHIYDYEIGKINDLIENYKKRGDKERAQKWMLRESKIEMHKRNLDKGLKLLKDVEAMGVVDTSEIKYKLILSYLEYYEDSEEYEKMVETMDEFIAFMEKPSEGHVGEFYTVKANIYEKYLDPEKAIETYNYAIENYGDGINMITTLWSLARLDIKAGKIDEGITNYTKLLDEIGGPSPVINFQRGEALLRYKNDTAAAYADLNLVLEMDTVVSTISTRHFALMLMGRTAEAEEWMKKIEEIHNEEREGAWDIYYNFACAYALVGMKEKAIEYLMTAIEKGFDECKTLKEDDDFDKIKDSAEFKSIMKVVCAGEE